MARFLKDFAAGPLDIYRKKASFDWKKLKIFLDTEDVVELEHELHNALLENPIFSNPLHTPSFEEQRRLAVHKMFAFRSIPHLNYENNLGKPRRITSISRTMIGLDPGAYIKHSLTFGMCLSVLHSMGTERHLELAEAASSGQIIVCYCLTEIGHGTNTKGMRTTATYNLESKDFVLHSPDFEAAKCWAGLLGQTATHAIVLAQLVTKGVNHGLHAFIVPIRDTRTFLPYPGVTVGDMGEKMGLNGLDNGFIIFNNYRIPKDSLLNKTGDVLDDGKYITPYKDPSKRHGASLGALSTGRVSITNLCTTYLTKGITIAVRYGAVRKQFGPENSTEEIPVLEYQLHQHRLLPYLAASYALRIFSAYIMEVHHNFALDAMLGQNKDIAPDLGLEIHAISSTSKPLSGWIARDGIQESREACAGHGYLKVAGIADVKNDHDANLTYEGENNVLIQQTSNWLLKFWPLVLKGENIATPLQSIHFLNSAVHILKARFNAKTVDQVSQPESIFAAFEWLLCYLLKQSFERLQGNLKKGLDPFTARNENQIYYAKNLSIVYLQHLILTRFYAKIQEATESEISQVLLKLFSLYGLWSLEKHLATLYQGGYASGTLPADLVQEAILKLCREIKDDAVSLVDVIAPPDFILRSALGASDGQVYKHLENAMYQSPSGLGRASWWKDIVELKSKL